eukprot:g8469.t1
MSSLRQYRDDNAVIRELTPEIRLLDMSDLHWCSVSTLPQIGLKCPNLRKISLRNLKQLNDAGIVAMGKGCPRLTEVDLSGCTNISALSLIKSTHKWTQLQILKLHRCKQIFDCDKGYGSQGSALSWKHLLKAARTTLHKFILYYEPVKTLYLLFFATMTKTPESDLDIFTTIQDISDYFDSEMKMLKKKEKANCSKITGNSFLSVLLDKIKTDDEHDIDLSTLYKEFEETPLEVGDYGKEYITRGYMKDFQDMTAIEHFEEFVHALVKIVGNVNFYLFLQASLQRYEHEFYGIRHMAQNNDIESKGSTLDMKIVENNFMELKIELKSFKVHVDKHKDLGAAFLNILSSESSSLREVDLSYCTTLNDNQLNCWSAPGITDECIEDLSEVWHEYNSWVKTGEWVITKEQLEQTTALGEAEKRYEVDKQQLIDLIAKQTHKSSMFHMEIHELRGKPASDGREGMTPQELKQLHSLTRKLRIAENRVTKTQEELEYLDVAINQVRKEAEETLASMAEGARKKAPEPRSKLMCIDLSGCHEITDESISWFSALCPKLCAIKMMSCDQNKLTHKSIESIVRSCGGLSRIDLSGCSQLDKRVTEALVTWSVDSIRHVSLSSCNKITSNNIRNLAEGCINVKCLDVEGHAGINEGVVTRILSQSHLHQLNISRCPKISLSFVKRLRTTYPEKIVTYFYHKEQMPLLNNKVTGNNKKKNSKSESKKKKK